MAIVSHRLATRFESFVQTFMQFTPLFDIHTPLIPLPDPTDLPDTGGDRGPVGRSPILGGPGAWGGRVWAEPRIFCDRRAQNALNGDSEDPKDPSPSLTMTHTQDRRVLTSYQRWTPSYNRIPKTRTALQCAYTQTLLCIYLVASLCDIITNHLTMKKNSPTLQY